MLVIFARIGQDCSKSRHSIPDTAWIPTAIWWYFFNVGGGSSEKYYFFLFGVYIFGYNFYLLLAKTRVWHYKVVECILGARHHFQVWYLRKICKNPGSGWGSDRAGPIMPDCHRWWPNLPKSPQDVQKCSGIARKRFLSAIVLGNGLWDHRIPFHTNLVGGRPKSSPVKKLIKPRLTLLEGPFGEVVSERTGVRG